MRAPYTQLYLHIIWATWDRLPLITPEIENRIFIWQGAYRAFTVRKSDMPVVMKYIENQKLHHAESSIKLDWEYPNSDR